MSDTPPPPSPDDADAEAAGTDQLQGMRPWVLALIVFVLGGLGLYAVAMSAPFVFDDFYMFTGAKPYVEQSMSSLRTARLLGNASLLLNYRLVLDEPVGFRVVNVAIHILAALAVYALATALLRLRHGDPRRDDEGEPAQRRRQMVALVAGGIFLAHPLATQAVTYIVQRYTSQCAMLYLWGLACYAMARCRQVRAGRWTDPGALALYGGALLLALAALLTKESALTWPFAVLLLETVLIRPALRDLAAGGAEDGAAATRATPTAALAAWRPLALFLLPPLALVLALGLWINLAGSTAGFGDGAPATQDAPAQSDAATAAPAAATDPATLTQTPSATDWSGNADITRRRYILTQIEIVERVYLHILVLPFGQTIDHHAPLRDSLTTPPVLFGAAIHLLLLAIALLGWRRSPFLTVGIALFYLGVAPSSSLVPNHQLVMEHRAYLSIVALSLAWIELARRWTATRRVLAVGLPLLALLGALTVARNHVWTSEYRLWADARQKNPEVARPWMVLADIDYREGRYAAAADGYAAFIARNPNYSEAYYRLGICRKLLGELPAARDNLQLALLARPTDPTVFLPLAEVLAALGDGPQALALVGAWAEREPSNPDAVLWVGLIASRLDQLNTAGAALSTVWQMRPGDPVAGLNLGRVLARLGEPDKAIAFYRMMLQRSTPMEAMVRFTLAKALRDAGDLDAAAAELQQVLALQPNFRAALATAAAIATERADTPTATALQARLRAYDADPAMAAAEAANPLLQDPTLLGAKLPNAIAPPLAPASSPAP